MAWKRCRSFRKSCGEGQKLGEIYDAAAPPSHPSIERALAGRHPRDHTRGSSPIRSLRDSVNIMAHYRGYVLGCQNPAKQGGSEELPVTNIIMGHITEIAQSVRVSNLVFPGAIAVSSNSISILILLGAAWTTQHLRPGAPLPPQRRPGRPRRGLRRPWRR